MELDAISGAATVALASTIVFVLVVKAINAVTRSVARTPSFADRILHESAQRFRDEFDRLTRSQSIYLSGTLFFVMLFAAAYFLRAKELFEGYPAWQLYVQLGFLSLAALFAAYRLGKTVAALYRVRFVRDANVAVGHQLRQLCSGYSRLYHDVETSAGIVDHVIVGQHGVYAVNVIARRARKNGTVHLAGHALKYSSSEEPHAIVDVIAKTRRLEKELRELLGHAIRVRSVIAIPGWHVDSQTGNEHLLVNERTIGVLTGWRDAADYLMNEDIELLQNELTERCSAA